MTWEQIRDGYGLQEVPKEWAGQLGCALCSPEFPLKGKLWTPEVVNFAPDQVVTIQVLSKRIDSLRGKCYCRTHAELMYK